MQIAEAEERRNMTPGSKRLELICAYLTKIGWKVREKERLIMQSTERNHFIPQQHEAAP
jgi:hypothetical protein